MSEVAELLARAIDAIEAILEIGETDMGEWKTIETAPMDGTSVLLFYPAYEQPVFVGYFVEREEFQYGKSVRKYAYWSSPPNLSWEKNPGPTHWIPIPAGPSDA